MDGNDFARWERLTHHVIRSHFSWAYLSEDNDHYKKYRRFLDYDDLVQEGHIALMYAWNRYDPSREDAATFKTYAFKAIYRRVAKFIELNVTPITARNWKARSMAAAAKSPGDDSEESKQLAAAISCILFSEGSQDDEGNDPWCSIEYTGDNDVPDDVVHKDWVNHCIGVLRRGLTNKEFSMILARAKGQTYGMISKRHNIKREIARRVVGEIMIKAAVLLIDQEVALDDE